MSQDRSSASTSSDTVVPKENVTSYISRSFRSQDPHDRIWDVLNLPKIVPAYNLCLADPEEIEYLLRLARCTITGIAGRKFCDFFPKQALAEYRDNKSSTGYSITTAAICWYFNDNGFWGSDGLRENSALVPCFPVAETISTGDTEELFMRFDVIPKFACWLADSFSTLCHYEREAEQRQHAEAEKFCEKIAEAFAGSPTSDSAKDVSREHGRLGVGGID